MDYKKILKEHKIDFIEEGNNVADGNINIKCPFCNDDPSEHLGINLKQGYWGCWRNDQHRGKDFAKLLSYLLKLHYNEVKQILRDESLTFLDDDDIFKNIKEICDNKDSMLSVETKEVLHKQMKQIQIPQEYLNKIIHKRAINYFRKRGFKDDVKSVLLFDYFDIKFSSILNELFFPIYYNDNLVTWQTRTINESAFTYNFLGKKESLMVSSDLLYNFDHLMKCGGKKLFIVEGIFDVLKLEYYLPKGFKATCCFTKNISDRQAYLLKKLSNRFKEIIILLDADAWIDQYKVFDKLLHCSNQVIMGNLPIEKKYYIKNFKEKRDPGNLNDSGVKFLLQ